MHVEELHMTNFRENDKSLIKQPTCYKNPTRPTCIDRTLTNLPCSLQSTCGGQTGLSDFHLMNWEL